MAAAKKTPGSADESAETLYFFPEDPITEAELKEILAGDDAVRRAWAISHLLRYAEWEDIWSYVDRESVRSIFPSLDLPENLRQAWARMLGVEAEVR
ncbi:MAG: hypothetical protein ACRD2Z_17690 [Thermoanaerobaculia bacterium]